MSNSNNNKIKIKNFSEVSEYLYDEYLEYFYNVEDSFFNNNRKNIYTQIIREEQIKFLEFMLNKYLLNSYDMCWILTSYKGKERPEEILNLIFKFNNEISKLLFEVNYKFREILLYSSLEYVKVYYKLRGEKLKDIKINLLEYHTNEFYDIRIFYWLLEKNIFNINIDLIRWVKHELKLNHINKDNFDNLLDLIKFNKLNFEYIFVQNNSETYYNSVLVSLIRNKRNEMIYYFFDKLEPKKIIFEKNVYDILLTIAQYNNYELFMFFIKHIFQLKYKSVLYNDYSIQQLGISINNNNNNNNTLVDEKIVFEIIKLGYRVPKKNLYFDYFSKLTLKK